MKKFQTDTLFSLRPRFFAHFTCPCAMVFAHIGAQCANGAARSWEECAMPSSDPLP